MKIKLIHLFILFFLMLGCSKNDGKIKSPDKVEPVNILYRQAFEAYVSGDWNSSVKLFEKVERYYSFSEWAPRATLMIIYINYEVSDSYKTLSYIEKFKKLYPANQNIPYVEFIKGLVFYEFINVTSKDQEYTFAALKQFNKLIELYPNSNYAAESILKIDLINEQLAGKELYVARYYMDKSKWIPAINRLEIIIKNFDTTIYANEALHRLVEIYYRLGNINQAKKYAAILGYNFNDSDWYKKSYKIVGNQNYNSDIIKTKKSLKNKIKKILSF